QLFFDVTGAAKTKSFGLLPAAGASAVGIGIAHVGNTRNEWREAALLLRLGGGQRQSAHGPSMERAEERNDVLPLGVVTGELQCAFNRFGAGVPVVNLVRARHRRDLG